MGRSARRIEHDARAVTAGDLGDGMERRAGISAPAAARSLDIWIDRVIDVPRFADRASAALAARSDVRCCIPTLRMAPEGGRPPHARYHAAA